MIEVAVQVTKKGEIHEISFFSKSNRIPFPGARKTQLQLHIRP
jgi:hypothetical protein